MRKFSVEDINLAISTIDPSNEAPPKKGYQSFSNSYERRFKSYQPSDGKGNRTSIGTYRKDYYTWCNYYVQDVLHCLGLLPDKEYPRTDMNCASSIKWLNSSPLWREISNTEAQQYANKGCIVVGTSNTHMVIVRAENNSYKMKDGKYPVCAQAGKVPKLWGYFESSNIRYFLFIDTQDNISNDILTKSLVYIKEDRYINTKTDVYKNVDLLSGEAIDSIYSLDRGTKVYVQDKLVFSNGQAWAYTMIDNIIGFVHPNNLGVSPIEEDTPIPIDETHDSLKDIITDPPNNVNIKYFEQFQIKNSRGGISCDKYGSPIDGTSIGMLSKGDGSSSEHYLNIINQTYEYLGESLWYQYRILPSLPLIIGIMESSLIPYGGYKLLEKNVIDTSPSSSNNILGMIYKQKKSGGAVLDYLDKPTMVRIPNYSMPSGYASQVYCFQSINECISYFGYLMNSTKYNRGVGIVNRTDIDSVFENFALKYLGGSIDTANKYIEMCKKFYNLRKYTFIDRDTTLCKRLGIY